jgi:tetratricopeptide (TPR) repeat protein
MQTTANLWETLCCDLAAQRTAQGAEQQHLIAKRFKEAATQVLRPNSPRICDAIEVAGDLCQSASFKNDAIVYFEEGFRTAIAIGNTASAARMSAKLAILLDETGDTYKARRFYTEAVAMYESLHDYSQHVMLLNSLASLCRRTRDYPSAEKAYVKAVDTAARFKGETHPDVALIANNLGVLYTDMGEYLKAENLHLRALGIRESIYGAMHPDVAQSMGNLAVVYHASGNTAKAEQFYLAALKTLSSFRTQDSNDVKSIRANYEKLSRSGAR